MIVDPQSSARIEARIVALADRFQFTVNADFFHELRAGLISRNSRILTPGNQILLGGYIEKRVLDFETLILDFYEAERKAKPKHDGVPVPAGPEPGSAVRILETVDLLLCEELLFSALVCLLWDQFADAVREAAAREPEAERSSRRYSRKAYLRHPVEGVARAARAFIESEPKIPEPSWDLARLSADSCSWLSFWASAALRMSLLKTASDSQGPICQAVLRSAAVKAQGAINLDRMKRQRLSAFVDLMSAFETPKDFDRRMLRTLEGGDADLFLTMAGNRMGFPTDIILLLFYGLEELSLEFLGRSCGVMDSLTRRISRIVGAFPTNGQAVLNGKRHFRPAGSSEETAVAMHPASAPVPWAGYDTIRKRHEQ